LDEGHISTPSSQELSADFETSKGPLKNLTKTRGIDGNEPREKWNLAQMQPW